MTPGSAAAPGGEHLLLYDGACGLCDRLVRLVLRRDGARRFRLAPLQGAAAAAILARLGRPAPDPAALATLLVVRDFRGAAPVVLERSAAALLVAAALGPPWSWAGLLSGLPRRWLDAGYDLVAHHRLRLFGGAEACRPVPPEERGRFLEPPGAAG